MTAALALAAVSIAHAASENDVIIGNGGAGPYPLDWKNFVLDSVTVSENSLTLTPGVDYKIDVGNGQITFTNPIGQQQTALVQYQYDPATAQRSSNQLVSPLKFDLNQSDSRELYVSAAVMPGSTAPGVDSAGNIALGVGSIWKGGGHDQFGAKLYFDPSVDTSPTAPAQTATGYAFTGSADAGRGSLFSYGFNRAEQSLLAQDGLQCGQQVANMTLHVAPETKVVADLGYKQSDSLSPGTPSTDQSTLTVTAKPIASTKATPGVDVSATAVQTVQSGASTDQTGLNVTVGKDKKVAVTTGVNVVDAADDATHQVMSVSTTVKPASAVQVSAGYQSRTANSSDTNTVDSLDTTTMQLSVKPAGGVTLTGNYALNPPDGNGNPSAMLQRGLGMQSAFGRMSVTGGFNWNRAAGTSMDATSLKLGVGWKVSGNGQITGGFQQAVGTLMTNNAYPWQAQYSVGYQHSMSNALSVTFAGSFDQHPGEAIAGTSDVAGNATVGLKF